MNIHIQIILWTCVHFSLLKCLKMELLDHRVVIYVFNFMRTCQTIFQSGSTILPSLQQAVPFRD